MRPLPMRIGRLFTMAARHYCEAAIDSRAATNCRARFIAWPLIAMRRMLDYVALKFTDIRWHDRSHLPVLRGAIERIKAICSLEPSKLDANGAK